MMNAAQDLVDSLTESMHPAVAYSALVGAQPTVWEYPWPATRRHPSFGHGWQRIGETTSIAAYLRARQHDIDAAAIGIICSITAKYVNHEQLVVVVGCDFASREVTGAHLHADGKICPFAVSTSATTELFQEAFTCRYS